MKYSPFFKNKPQKCTPTTITGQPWSHFVFLSNRECHFKWTTLRDRKTNTHKVSFFFFHNPEFGRKEEEEQISGGSSFHFSFYPPFVLECSNGKESAKKRRNPTRGKFPLLSSLFLHVALLVCRRNLFFSFHRL